MVTAVTQLLPSIWLASWLSTENDDEKQALPSYPTIFGVLIGVYMLLTVLRSFTICQVMSTSATNLHDLITRSVLRATVLFFEQNPAARILSRFSKDLVIFDIVVPSITAVAA